MRPGGRYRMNQWRKMTDERLAERLEKEKKLLRKIDPKERAIARTNIEEITAEQARRYEETWGIRET
jgi:hypothetical protein